MWTNTMRRQSGFSIVELMVGMVIAMIAVVIMMQIFSVSEGYKRTTTGGDDAQNNGAIGLYGLQRDLRQAGEGAHAFTDNAAATSAFSIVGCNLTLRAGVTINGLGPVMINNGIPATGVDANTDRLLVFHGSSDDNPEGDRIAAQPATNVYRLSSFLATGGTPSVKVGDWVIAVPTPRPSPCNLTMEQVTAVVASDVTVGTGVAGMTNGALFNMGASPRFVSYAVRGGNLTSCDYMANNCGSYTASDWVSIASNIASLRAQYGHDNSVTMDTTVDLFNQTSPANVCQWVRMRAVRLALVSRSAILEKLDSAGNHVTANVPAWAGSASSPSGSAVTPIDLSSSLSDGSSWQDYRYKVFETTVPLRNLAWLGVQTGC